jgi:hypothetical protein
MAMGTVRAVARLDEKKADLADEDPLTAPVGGRAGVGMNMKSSAWPAIQRTTDV